MTYAVYGGLRRSSQLQQETLWPGSQARAGRPQPPDWSASGALGCSLCGRLAATTLRLTMPAKGGLASISSGMAVDEFLLTEGPREIVSHTTAYLVHVEEEAVLAACSGGQGL